MKYAKHVDDVPRHIRRVVFSPHATYTFPDNVSGPTLRVYYRTRMQPYRFVLDSSRQRVIHATAVDSPAPRALIAYVRASLIALIARAEPCKRVSVVYQFNTLRDACAMLDSERAFACKTLRDVQRLHDELFHTK